MGTITYVSHKKTQTKDAFFKIKRWKQHNIKLALGIPVSSSQPVGDSGEIRYDSIARWFLPYHDADNTGCLPSGW